MDKTNKKVLIVEDERDFLLIVQNSFLKEGFETLVAKDGKEGLDMAEKEKPDIIILDILLPQMDGITMAKKLKEAGVKTPIIFLTNVKDVNTISKALEAREADYFVKADTHIADIVARAKSKLGLK